MTSLELRGNAVITGKNSNVLQQQKDKYTTNIPNIPQKLWYIHTMECDTRIRMNEPIHTTRKIHTTVFGERSQT